MNYNNTVIKVLNKEHGKKVIQWWKDQGVNTEYYTGSFSEENNNFAIYYGIINGRFYNCTIEDVNRFKLKIIELPTNEYPKIMRVSDKPFSLTNPIAYTVDIGIQGKHLDYKPFLIEFNDMWAIGPYGCKEEDYFSMLKDRWNEIIR